MADYSSLQFSSFSSSRSVFLLLILLFCCSELQAAKPAKWITIQGNEIVIRAKADQLNLPVRVDLAEGVKRENVRLWLRDVRYDKELDGDLLAAFKVDSLLTKEGQMLISLDLKGVGNLQGSYDVYIEVLNKNAAGSRETISLKIKHPAASLQAIPTRVVDRVGPFLMGDVTVNGTQLDLRETSKKSRLTDLSLKQKSFSNEKKQPVDVKLRFESEELEIKPNGFENASFILEGDFPLGKTEGQAEIDAPQLAKPIAVKFEINTRLNPNWIFIIIIIGFILGWFLRQHLKQRIERSDALLEGIKVRDSILESLEKLYPDSAFQESMLKAKDELNVALRDENVAGIKAAATKAKEALNAAITDLETRRTTEGARIGLLEQITDTPDRFPKDWHPLIENIQAETQMAMGLLKENRIVACKEKIDEIRNNLLYMKLGSWWKSWKASLSVQLKIDGLQPKPVLDYAKTAAASIASVLEPLEHAQPDTTIEEYEVMMDTISEIRSNLHGFILSVDAYIRREKEATIRHLKSVNNIPAPKAIENLDLVAEQQLEQLENKEAEEALKYLNNPDWLIRLDKAWKDAILKQNNKADVVVFINGGEYTQAAAQAAANINAAAGGINPAANINAVNDASPLESTFESSWTYTTAENSRSIMWMLPPFFRPLQTGEIPDEVTIKRIRNWSIALQNVFSILLLTTVGYLLFEEGFVGRVEEWIKIGLWAFGIDITIDKVVEQAKLVGK